MKKIETIQNIVEWRLCVGCGACVSICEKENISLRDIYEQGIRPIPKKDDMSCAECMKCIDVCPGIGISHSYRCGSLLKKLKKGWGPILDIWEGYAIDSDIRFSGSSGGAATAIALYCIESGLSGGVIHTSKDETEPWRNRTVFSKNRHDLLLRTGSRYSPASPCDGLEKIEASSSPIVFIGKPCDVQGLRKYESINAGIIDKTIAIGIFCAGTPSTKGVLDLLQEMKVSKEEIKDIRFRGNGWPGFFKIRYKDGSDYPKEMSYKDSWHFLQAYRNFRCYLCPDGTSEFADISCGDPWYRKPERNDLGRSLILVRTEKGRAILNGAIKAGYIQANKAQIEILENSQINLLLKRKAIWGRLFAMKMFGIPTPRLIGFELLENWLELPIKEKVISILGTVRRIVKRKYFFHAVSKNK